MAEDIPSPENRVLIDGDEPLPGRIQRGRQIRDAFYTDTDAWKTRIVEQGVAAAHQALQGLGTKAA